MNEKYSNQKTGDLAAGSHHHLQGGQGLREGQVLQEGQGRCFLAHREGFKNPRHGNFPLRGYPPPPGPPRTRFFRKVSGKKLTEKGGTPPPSTDNPFRKTEIFSPKTAVFAQKTPFLGQFLMDFFLTERGGTPLPPSTDGRFPKTQRKKVNGKGGYPPPFHGKFPCRGFLNPSLTISRYVNTIYIAYR